MPALTVVFTVVIALTVSVGAQDAVDPPTPRTAFDGKPDLSGTWRNVGRDDHTAEPESVTLNDIPHATLVDIGAGYRIGLPLHPWAAALKSMRMKALGRPRSDDGCASLGNQQSNAHAFPRQIVHAPGVVAIVYGTSQGSRQIFTDGRPRRSEGTQAFSRGYSRGAWSGDTLVVLTTHFREGGWLDLNGSPLTAAGRTIERFRRVSGETMEIEQTIDDQKAYSRPFTTRLTWRLTDSQMAPPPCR